MEEAMSQKAEERSWEHSSFKLAQWVLKYAHLATLTTADSLEKGLTVGPF